jgi:hypothetical protein
MKKLLMLLGAGTYLYGAEVAFSFGAHDMVVPNARPLSQTIYEPRGNGRDSHTVGFNVALYAKSDTGAFIEQFGHFRVFYDFDTDYLDPDHIPVWFIGEYEAKIALFTMQKYGRIMADVDFSGKANTVSSVERLLRFFGGVKYEYVGEQVSFESALLAGRYSLEFDDDTPAQRGYVRESLKEISLATSLKASFHYSLNKNFTLYGKVQEWQSSGELLEKYVELGMSIDSSEFIAKSRFYVEASYDWYNIDRYDKEGLLPIVPWDKDILFNAYIKIPVNFEELVAQQ